MENLLPASIQQMSAAERIQLVQDIWDSIAATEEVAVTAAQLQEIERRLDLYQQDPTAGSTWNEVRERIQQN